MFAYCVLPIDFHWEFLPTVKETAEKIGQLEGARALSDFPTPAIDVQAFIAQYQKAVQAADKVGWQGDFREEPRVFWLPHAEDNSFAPAFVWKQGHAGDTFVMSPVELPYLKRHI